MALSTARCVAYTPRIRLRCTQWLLPLRRRFGSSVWDESSFLKLRAEMLDRTLPALPDVITRAHMRKLAATLAPFLPRYIHNSQSLGEHLINFNTIVPSNELLPDGLDSLHSPGDPFVRRMWAGGSMVLDVPSHYSEGDRGWKFDKRLWGVERIKDVQMRGPKGEEKIFVIIERWFARDLALRKTAKKELGRRGYDIEEKIPTLLRRQMEEKEEWGDATLVEERNLVFLKARGENELEAFRTGQLAPVRYLERSSSPEFSHTLTPTPTLLFRYSALTFNAHAIHLDLDYCRNVEGYPNLLVHGPLSLTLLLKFVEGHIQSLPGDRHVIRSIVYRNFAPLYCGQEMRLCGRKKEDVSTDNVGVYEVWIEGPAGGVAVKGTIRTSQLKSPAKGRSSKNDHSIPESLPPPNRAIQTEDIPPTTILFSNIETAESPSLLNQTPITKIYRQFDRDIKPMGRIGRRLRRSRGIRKVLSTRPSHDTPKLSTAESTSSESTSSESTSSESTSSESTSSVSPTPLLTRKEKRAARARARGIFTGSAFANPKALRSYVLNTSASEPGRIGIFRPVRRVRARPPPMTGSVSRRTQYIIRRLGLIKTESGMDELKLFPMIRTHHSNMPKEHSLANEAKSLAEGGGSGSVRKVVPNRVKVNRVTTRKRSGYQGRR